MMVRNKHLHELRLSRRLLDSHDQLPELRHLRHEPLAKRLDTRRLPWREAGVDLESGRAQQLGAHCVPGAHEEVRVRAVLRRRRRLRLRRGAAVRGGRVVRGADALEIVAVDVGHVLLLEVGRG